MSSISALRTLIKVALNYDMPDLNEEQNYIDLLNMLKKAINKSKINLLIMLFEQMFIENGNIKKCEENQKIDDFNSYCHIKSLPNNLKDNKEFIIIEQNLFYPKINEVELTLIYYLMNINKSPLLLFKCIEAVLSEKDKYYIKNKEIKIENINYYTFLFRVGQFFRNDSIDNICDSQYTLDFKDNKVFRKELTNKEIGDYLLSKEIKISELIKFMKANAKIKNIIKNNKKAEKLETKIVDEKKDLQKQIDLLRNKINDLESRNNQLYEKISDYKKKSEKTISELLDYKKNTEKTIYAIMEELKMQKSEYNKKIEDIGKKNDDTITILKKEIETIKNKINFLEIKNTSLLDEKNILNQELISGKTCSKKKIDELNTELKSNEIIKERIEKEIDLIQIRNISQFIIDFLYSIIFKEVNLSMKYEDKINSIYKDIIDKTTTKNKINFVKLLIEFLFDIEQKRVNGFKLAHVDFKNIIFNGYENVGKFLFDYLGASKYFSYFNSLYQAKKIEEINHNIKVIKKIVESFDFYAYLNDFVV